MVAEHKPHAHAFTITSNPPKIMRLPSKGIWAMSLSSRGSALDRVLPTFDVKSRYAAPDANRRER
jgi:hypothetical protein